MTAAWIVLSEYVVVPDQGGMFSRPAPTPPSDQGRG